MTIIKISCKHTIILLGLALVLSCLKPTSCLLIPKIMAAQTSEQQRTFTVKSIPVAEIYEAMGTIRPLTESDIHSQITAKVLKVQVSAGDRVEQGDLLIKLDNRELITRLEQAKEGLAIAERGVNQALKTDEELTAAYNQAESEYNRSDKLFKEGIHSKKEFDQAKTTYLKVKAQLGLSQQRVFSAKASLRQAGQIVHEAEIFAGYANILATDSGIITKRQVEPGDLATPSKTLLTIQTGSILRLEAGIRESLISKVKIGMPLTVKIGTDNTAITGVVEEIEPYANAKTRSFMVKVGIPETPGIFPGMFGRLLIPLDIQPVILIPAEAITRVGQLESVHLVKDNKVNRIFVRTGSLQDGKVEILSGLQDGDQIVF